MSNAISLKILYPVLGFTLIFAVAGMIAPTYVADIQYPLFVILVLIIGLPHGATDYLLYHRLNGKKLRKSQKIRFFIFYLSCVLGFIVLWTQFPVLSFCTFILISAYHFGQSNWESVDIAKPLLFILYSIWGAFTIGGAVLWHWDESSLIITQLIGFEPEISKSLANSIQLWLITLNGFLIFLLKWTHRISHDRFANEFLKLSILSVVFYSTPMLVGFTLYFALWHSLSSLLNQVAFYRQLWPSFSITDYYRQAAPYTLLAVFGLLLMIIAYRFYLPDVSYISTFMIFIASMTLPHIFLVEQSYHQ